jgi:hypothetical protein
MPYSRVLSLLLFVMPVLAWAQDPLRPDRREELWLSAGVRGKLPSFLKDPLGDTYKRIRLSGEAGYRSADNFFAGRQIYVDVGGRYDVAKWFAVGAEYRYAFRPDQADRQRLGLQAFLDKSAGKFDFDYRFTFQRNFLEEDRRTNQFRNRFGVAYNIPKWKLDPAFSAEFFTDQTPMGLNWIGTRFVLGTSFSPWKGHSFSPQLVVDRDQNVPWPVYRTIFSLDYTLDLRRL